MKSLDQRGFVGLIILVLIVIAGVAIYSFVKAKANEYGFELPF